MPTSVTSSSGVSYHLWQLPDLSAPEPSDTLTITTLKNDLGDGYSNSILFGSNTGLRTWKLKLPTLAGTNINIPFVTDIYGASVTRERYIRSLFIENKVTGTPFAYPDPNTGQYYLVDFDEDDLTLERMRVKLYSTGLTLKQRRIQGVTIFNVAGMYGSEPDTWMKDTLTDDQSGNSHPLVITGDVDPDGLQNNISTWQFNTDTTTGLMARAVSQTYYDIFLVLKCRGATFPRTSGVITGASVARVLIGTNGTTKFTDLSHTNFEYRLNDVVYTQSNMQAPMNTYGIVHLRFSAGKAIDGFQMGQDRAVAGTHAEIDVGDIILFTSLLPTYLKRELIEYLTVKYAIV